MNEVSLNEQLTNATLAWRVFDEITYKKIETSYIGDYSGDFRDPTSPGQSNKPLMAMARCGGPLASIYKTSKPTSNEQKYTIIIQNVPKSFRKIREFDRGLIVFVDFTIDEDLLIVTDDGKYHLIDIFHLNTSNDRTITLSENVSTISSACAFKSIQGTGLVALKKNQEGFLAVKNVYNPVIQTISLGLELRSNISSWCVLDPTDMNLVYSYDNVVATSSAASTRREQQTLPGMTIGIVKLVTSDNYKIVAMLRDNGDVLICPREKIGLNQSFVLKYSNPSDKPKINDIVWCGSDAVIGIRSTTNTWFDLLIINGKNTSFQMTEKSQYDITNETLCYTSTVFLFTEIDGVRIVSGRNLDFFQRLPTELFSVCSLMSESPGAKLYSAYLNYKYENQTSEILLNQLKSSPQSSGLEQAVKQCIFAASYEHDPPLQKLLLKAALFGRSFLSVNLSNSSSTSSTRPSITMINDLCTNVIRQLHLVNNLQHLNISLPLTYQQFELIGTEMLIDRLLRRNLHDFATHVTKLLHIPAEKGENRILVQWAVQQINNSTNGNEEIIAKNIKDRLGNVPGIPFINIAREAFKAKKFVVVERLLDVKVSLSDQIDMLLQLNKKDEALQKAISCGDTDLVLYVLMRTKPTGSPHEYIIKLSKMKNLPLNLLLQSLEERERISLHNDMIKHNPEERERIAYSHILQRFSGALTIADQRTELNSAVKLFREMKNETHAQLVDDEARLISRQDDLEKKLINVQLRGLSLVDTLEILLVHNEREADLMKKEFNMSDKRFYWIKIQTLAKKQSWSQLMEFARKSTSPIGYEPFLDVCLRSNKTDEARRYADRTMFSSKIDDERLPFMFAKVQMIDEAINAAIKLKSSEALDFIESKCQLNEANAQRVRQARDKFQDPGKSWLLGGFLKS